MGDFDVLIPTQQVLEVIVLLTSMGWTARVRALEALTDDCRAVRHTQAFRDSSGCELDLHWNILSGNPEADADNDFWEGAHEVKIQDLPTFTLNPKDQPLHVAAWEDAVRHVRWVADAMMILKVAKSEIDWNRFLIQARKRQLVIPLRD